MTVHERGLHFGSLGHEVTGAVNAGLEKARQTVRSHPIRTATAGLALTGLAVAAVGIATLRGGAPLVSANEVPQTQSGTVLPPADLSSVGVLTEQRPTGGAAGGGEGDGEPPKQPEGGLPGVLPDQPSQPSTEGPPEEGEGDTGNNGEPSQPDGSQTAGGGVVQEPAEPVAVAPVSVEPRPQRPAPTVVEDFPEARPDGSIVIVQKLSDGSFRDGEIIKPADPRPAAAPALAPADQEEKNTGVEGPPPFKPNWSKYAGDPSPSKADEALAEDMLNQYFASMTALHPKLAETAEAIKKGNKEGTLKLFIEDSGGKAGDRLRVVNGSTARQGNNRLFGLNFQPKALKDTRNSPLQIDSNLDFFYAFRWIEEIAQTPRDADAASDKRVADKVLADVRALRAEILAGKR